MFPAKPQLLRALRIGRTGRAWIALLVVVALCGMTAGEEGFRVQGSVPMTANAASPQSAARTEAQTAIRAVFERLPPVEAEVLAVAATQIAVMQEVEEVPAPLTLVDLEQMALANNPSLRIASANVSAARGQCVQAGLYPNTVIGYSADEIGDEGTAGMQGGFVAQKFITGGKLRLDQAKACQEVRAQQFLYTAQELRVLNDVRMRFYTALVAQRQVDLTDELLGISGQFVDYSQRLLAAQQLSKNDVLLSEIESQESEIVAANSKNKSDEAWRRLAAVVGASELAPQPLDGELDRDIPEYTWEESYAQAVVMNPELSAAEARVRRARIAIERARKQNVPNIDVMVTGQHMNQSHDDILGIQAGFPLPILDRNQGNIYAAEADLIAATNEVRRIEFELQDRLAVALRRYADARQQAERYKSEILPRAQQSLDLVTRGYASGQVDFLTLLTSQRTYIRVNLAYLATLDELWQAATLIDGQLLSGSLQGDSQLKITPQEM